MRKNINFKIYTLGCKINQYDSASLKNFLIKKGFKKGSENLDIIIINSCSVTKVAIHKAQKLMSSLKKEFSKAKIVLIGCWPRVYTNLKEDRADLIWFGKSDNWENFFLEIEKTFFSDLAKNNSCQNNQKEKTLKTIGDRSRYFIKVQDGCSQFCSYCVIPFTRGPLKSRKVEDILSEIKSACQTGYQEIVLSGIHLGLYGVDFKDGQINLFYLLKKILEVDHSFRIRLSSIEINELSDDILELTAKSKGRICPHFHISLQSGSDKILKLMNRPYNTSYFEERIKKIRELIPDASISTDVIVGFPGEDENDFVDSYNFCQKMFFAKIHVFSFSAHEKARAYYFPNQNNLAIIKERSKKLRALSLDMEKKHLDFILSKASFLDVLVDKNSGLIVKGKTQYYFDYSFDFKKYSKVGTRPSPGKIFRLNLK